jgi:hypothetical protein
MNTSGSKAERNSQMGFNYCGVIPGYTTVSELRLCEPVTFFNEEDGPQYHLKCCSHYSCITVYY